MVRKEYNYISMLRGINVSGQKKIRMAELKELYQSLQYYNVQTYLQSGNVIFSSKIKEHSKLKKVIESEIEKTFGFYVNIFLREIKDFKRIIETNPFLIARNENPSHLYVTFLGTDFHKLNPENLENKKYNADEFIAGKKEIFVFCPNGYGRTKLNNNFFEKKLKVNATTRNWKTVNALYKIAFELQGVI